MIREKNPDNDQKIRLESKDEMKERLWRSPDYADAIMLRMHFEVMNRGEEHQAESNQSTLIEVDYGLEWMLG